MNKLLLSVIVSFLFVGASIAQKQEAKEIPLEKWCGTAQVMNERLATPEGKAAFIREGLIREWEKNNFPEVQRGMVYQIPIVFHILHNGGPENVDESQIMNALEVLNRDFRLQNPDTASILPQFKPLLRDVEIEFVLATKAPNGDCFKGYTRTNSAATFSGGGLQGIQQVTAIKNGNDVYQGVWPGNKYLNVFVVADAGGAGGYTNKPSNQWGLNTAMENGIWILYTQFGEIGTSGPSAGRSLTHECGHWFNLSHTWGNSNNPGITTNCQDDDGINDTPNCMGAATAGCNLNDANCSGLLANAQNYMDYYLPCQSMFTDGQVTEMRLAVQSSVGGRSNLWTGTNLNATGAGVYALCKADFEADRTSICAGEQIQFSDLSFNNASGWTWTFQGGTPSSSSLENPTVTYATPGLYEVTLNSTDGTASDTETKTGYIRVLNPAVGIPFLEHFEGYSTLSGIPQWSIENPDGNNAWELETTTGHTGNRCARLLNHGEANNSNDELVSSTIDLSGVTGSLTMSFRYAYKRRTSTDEDWLRVSVSGDCGNTWSIRKTLFGSLLSSSVQSTPYTPASQSEWMTVHMTNITSGFWVNNFRCKFGFESGEGNNIFLDNINIYAGTPSDELVVNVTEEESLSNLSVYPNPTEDELNIRFAIGSVAESVLTIRDISGKIIQQNVINAQTGNNLVLLDTKNVSSGVYFLTINVGQNQQTIRFVKK